MTPAELETFRLNCRFVALEALLAALINAGIRTEAGRQEQMRELDQWLESLETIKLPQPGQPELSDLFAAEFQQAAQSLVSFIKLHLENKS